MSTLPLGASSPLHGEDKESPLLACTVPQASITPCTSNRTANAGSIVTVTYSVFNGITTEAVTFQLSYVASGSVASCSVPQSVVVQANSSNTFDLSCTMSSTAGSGSVTVTAEGDFGTVDATLNVTVRKVVVTQKGGIAIVNNQAARADTFQVENLDSAPVSLTFEAACRPTVPAANCTSNPASANIAGNGLLEVYANFDPPTGVSPNDSGRVILRALSSNVVMDSGWSHVAVAGAMVARIGASPVIHPPNQGGGSRTASFNVTNKAQFPKSYGLVIACTGAGVTNCAGPSTTNVSVRVGRGDLLRWRA